MSTKQVHGDITIYVAMKQSDMTEGCGQMIPDELFKNKLDAENFIDQQVGVAGRSSKHCDSKRPWSKQVHGDWQVKPMILNKGELSKEQSKKNKAHFSALKKLDQLTDAEREALVNAKVLNA